MRKKILVTPLDWGLGHASRCVALIRYLQQQELDVYLASSGDAGILLKEEFPELPYLSLPAHNIRYDSSISLSLGILKQFSSLFDVIMKEKETVAKYQNKYHFDLILSDNRYGCHNEEVPCIFLCHQLGIRSPLLPSLTGYFLRKCHYRLMRGFQYFLIPDFPGQENLSGALSHGFLLPVNSFYIGPVSRFAGIANEGNTYQNQCLLAVLSGPEPQRSQLEKILTEQSRHQGIPIKIVCGLLSSETIVNVHEYCVKIPYLTSYQLLNEINQSKIVLCRSGYSSLMDIAFTGKKAILIPTPGQTEQEYLAQYHYRLGNYYSVAQKTLNLGESIGKSLHFNGLHLKYEDTLLNRAFKNILGEL